jgi:hypothetical protein
MLVRPPTPPAIPETPAARRRARIRARDFETRMRRQRSRAQPRGRWPALAALLDRLLAPATAAGTTARGARLFHPSGAVVRGQATAIASEPALLAVAERLAGPVIIRFSGGWWKDREWPDLLGAAVRFTDNPDSPNAAAGDQDLLLITTRRFWQLPIAPLTTHQHDYLDNDYFGAAAFVVEGVGEAEVRLVRRARPEHDDGGDRNRRLVEEAETGAVVLQLDVRPRHGAWLPVVEIRLDGGSRLDQDRLRFSAFRAGRGIAPTGFVQRLRKRTYAWSQAARSVARITRAASARRS